MSLKGSTLVMFSPRLVTTACPMPAEARTTTEIVVTTRMAQRGFFLRTGLYGGPHRRPPGAGRLRAALGDGAAGVRGSGAAWARGTPPRG